MVSMVEMTLSMMAFVRQNAGLQRNVDFRHAAFDFVDDRNDRRFGDFRECVRQADSSSFVPRRWPATLMTSSTRPRMR